VGLKNEVGLEVKIRYPTSQVFDANRMRHVHHVGGHPGSTPNRSIYYCTVYQRVASRILFFIQCGFGMGTTIRVFGLSDNCESETLKSFLLVSQRLAITGSSLRLSLPATAEDFKPWAKAVRIPRSFSTTTRNSSKSSSGGRSRTLGCPVEQCLACLQTWLNDYATLHSAPSPNDRDPSLAGHRELPPS
jgi:hypothetical protein